MRSLAALFICLTLLFNPLHTLAAGKATPFVVQLTRTPDNNGHRRTFLQIDRILDEVGEDKVKFTVVAYEEGLQALLADNKDTATLLSKLAQRGVVFKACRISMRAWGVEEKDFPLEVEYVPAGAPEVIRLQLKGYKYWQP